VLMVLMVFYAAMIFAEPLSNDQRHFGLVDPVFTPFTEDGVVNTAVIDEYANWTHSMSTDTVILGGSTGVGHVFHNSCSAMLGTCDWYP